MIGTGEIGNHLPDQPWVLIFGGVTREGNRRARRAARTALQEGISVVWFDGYEEALPAPKEGRVPLDEHDFRSSVVVVGYAEREREHPVLRMLQLPDGVGGSYPAWDSSSWMATVRLSLTRLVWVLRKKVLWRVGLIFRGVLGWRIVRADVAKLAAETADPHQMLFGDDFSQTQAWHAARIWPEVPTGMELRR